MESERVLQSVQVWWVFAVAWLVFLVFHRVFPQVFPVVSEV